MQLTVVNMKQATTKCETCHGTGRVPDKKAIGSKFRAMRVDAGFSLREFAGRMKISHAYLDDLERGDRNFPEDLQKRYRLAIKTAQ